jgi:hypothetical protein
MPLDQRIANVAMVRDALHRRGTPSPERLALLAKQGWRDTPSLQNMLYVAATNGDLPRIIDISDALLRRRQLLDQMLPVLTIAEGDSSIRDTLATRIIARPGWRESYFSGTGYLQQRGQLRDRYEFMRLLQQRGARLDRSEVAPTILALDRHGMPQYGFSLWRMIRPDVTRPLDDTRFTLASRSYQAGQEPVPYQWQMMTGEGYSADASVDGAHGVMTVEWSGRGVPVFAQQRTSAAPGSYALDVKVAPEDRNELSVIAFRLICPDEMVEFEPVGQGSQHYITRIPVRCAYPILQIAGDIQPSASAHQLTFHEIVMRSVPSSSSRH